MFGYVSANLHDLDEGESTRYRAAYCGLCHALKERYGQASRMSLTYDMTFLTLLLGSLYEPEENDKPARCALHPATPQPCLRTLFSDYAADLSVALSYHKCLDDWNDDKSLPAKTYASMLKRAYESARERLPRQCEAIEAGLADIARIEKAQDATPDPDAAANRFGEVLGELFVWREDIWADAMRRFGGELGRFIYFMDAACDLEQDLRKGSYNPLATLDMEREDIDEALKLFAARATVQFEKLPLERDLHLLRSVLYSGIWQKRNTEERKRLEREAKHDKNQPTKKDLQGARQSL